MENPIWENTFEYEDERYVDALAVYKAVCETRGIEGKLEPEQWLSTPEAKKFILGEYRDEYAPAWVIKDKKTKKITVREVLEYTYEPSYFEDYADPRLAKWIPICDLCVDEEFDIYLYYTEDSRLPENIEECLLDWFDGSLCFKQVLWDLYAHYLGILY